MTPEQLKASILQYAIQGKLVEQRSEEGTAEDLYQQIQEEKLKLIKEGKLKKEKPLSEISEDEIPFDIPDTWRWSRIGDVYAITMGQSPAGKSVTKGSDGIEFHQGKVFFGEDYILKSDQVTSEPSKIAEPNSVLLCVRAPVGIVNITDRELCIGRGLCAVKPLAGMTEKYALYSLRCLKDTFIKKATGTTFVAITGEVVKNQIIPLPPLEEQHRIVAKIEELLPYVDRYANAYEKLKKFNAKFPEDMKKSILQYAIQGKLVEQRPEDGTAEELYQQIQDEKQKLIKAGKIKKEKPLAEITEDEAPFDIPDTWKWVRLGDIYWYIDAGKSPNCQKTPVKNDEWGVITTTSIQIGYFDDEQNKVLPASFEVNKTMQVHAGDILITRAGPMNRTGIACNVENIRYNLILSDKTLRINMTNEFINKKYIVMILNSPQIRNQLIERMSGMDKQQVNISQEKYKTVLLPIPPLEEQQRIVKKVEELLPYCERLVE
ncbi:restriction endonuclease subunit S [Butyrivibrio fibrisolvens]|uniref:restriction endonuclease subunit S n=1 Tax=Butyrivibrio fibrisolvens TaxID=831 RepID=UPI0003B5337A|nr:restriction endonuclease subunit S [Butyrivibrio fibrisolvens]